MKKMNKGGVKVNVNTKVTAAKKATGKTGGGNKKVVVSPSNKKGGNKK